MILTSKTVLSYTTADCPKTALSFGCNCHVTTKNDPTHFTPSGNYLTISCGSSWSGSQGTMTDVNVVTLFNQILNKTPVEAIGIYYQKLTKIPVNLKQFPNLKAVSLQGNGITSANAADLTWATLIEIQLQSNAITSLSGKFALASQFQSDGKGKAYFDLSNNAALTSLSNASFSLSADNVYVSFQSCSLASVNGGTFTLSATQKIFFDLGFNRLTVVSGNFNLIATDATNGDVTLYLNNNNQLTSLSPAKFYLNGAYNVQFSFFSNSITSVTADRITLKSTRYILLDLSYNKMTSVKLALDTNPPLTQGQTLYLNNNNLAGTIDCNDLGINNGAAAFYYYMSFHHNQISGVNNCGAGSLLDTVKSIGMNWYYNSFTSLPTGSFNFAAKLRILNLVYQNTPFTSIAPGALPGINKLIMLQY